MTECAGDKITPEWDLNSGLDGVTVTFPGTPPKSFTLDIEAVEDVLTNLGIMRRLLTPAVAPEWIGKGQVSAIRNPSWKVQYDVKTADPVLHIRDPRYGWLHYVFSKEDWKQGSAFQ